jgi:hypothetical protein
VKTIDAITFSNLDINKRETKVINLSSFNLKGDASYIASVTMSDDRKIEKTFGYITNGLDYTTKPYNVEVSGSEIILK